jgi:uncharacterized protein (TIGR03435 family)
VINGAARVPQVASTIVLPDPATQFEAASVRQNKTAARGGSYYLGNGRLTIRNLSLKELMLFAFQLDEPRLIGGPGWLDADRFDVVAKSGDASSDHDLRVMTQNLLIERFVLKVHAETRNLPIYTLVMARADGKLGPNLHATDCESFSSRPGPCRGMGLPSGQGPPPGAGRGGISFSNDTGRASAGGGGSSFGTSPVGSSTMSGSLSSLVSMLSGIVKRPVVDRTGLKGRFLVGLRYTMPGTPSAADGDATQRAPELFTALQEQLGLKLEATRGPVEVLVIDSAEHPVNDDFVMPAQ